WSVKVQRHGLAVAIAAATWGLAIIGFGFARTLWLALVCLAVAGGADIGSGLFCMTIWNQTISDHLRGRVAGIVIVMLTTRPEAWERRVRDYRQPVQHPRLDSFRRDPLRRRHRSPDSDAAGFSALRRTGRIGTQARRGSRTRRRNKCFDVDK